MDTESFFLKQPPRILGLANAVKLLPTETGDGDVSSIINNLQDNYANQNHLIALGNKNNDLILEEVTSINKKLEKLVGFSNDGERRAKLQENRDRQTNSRMLKGLQKVGNDIKKALKGVAGTAVGGILDALFPGMSRMLQAFGKTSGQLAGGLLTLLLGVPIARKIGAKLIDKFGSKFLGKELTSGVGKRFKANMNKSGLFGALYGTGKYGFTGTKGTKTAIKSMEFFNPATNKFFSHSMKDVRNLVKLVGFGNLLKQMKNMGIVMTGMNGVRGLSGDSYKVFADIMKGGTKSYAGLKFAKGFNASKDMGLFKNFNKTFKQMFAKSGLGKFFAKKGTEAASKTIGKKVPFLGAILGTIFAVDRWQHGDKLGAGLEVLSGLLSMIPGYGTAGSIITDIILFMRDIGNANGQKGGFWGGVKGLAKGGLGGLLGVLGGGAAGATLLQRLSQSGNMYEVTTFGTLAKMAGVPGLGLLFDAFSGGNGQFMDKLLGGGGGATTPNVVGETPSVESFKETAKDTGEKFGKGMAVLNAINPSSPANMAKNAANFTLSAISAIKKGKNPLNLTNLANINPLSSPVKNANNLITTVSSLINGTSNTTTPTPASTPIGTSLWSHAVSSPYGGRINPITKKWGMHYGVDYRYKLNEPVLSPISGTVISTGYQKSKSGTGYGNYIVIQDAKGMQHQFAHASKILAQRGQKINANDVIMLAGHSGGATGDHVDYKAAMGGYYYTRNADGTYTKKDATRGTFMGGVSMGVPRDESKGAPIPVSIANFATDATATLTNALLPNMAGGMAQYTTRKAEFVDSVWAKYNNMKSGMSEFQSGDADDIAMRRGTTIPESYLTKSMAPGKYNVTTQQALPSVDINSLLWYQLLMQQ